MKMLYRYLPLVLLAVFWEMAARLELVSSSALPPLSDVIVSWIDLIKTGELTGNTGETSTSYFSNKSRMCSRNAYRSKTFS